MRKDWEVCPNSQLQPLENRLTKRSGKSSLLLVLLRLLDMDSGTIFIDGIDLQVLPREVIRNRLICIPQDAFIRTDTTLRLNIDPSSSLPESILISALSKVGLWELISSRGGLDEPVKSQPLSQGQQQLFCLARAMVRKSKILVLDEATSNIDLETERRIQKVVREEFIKCTVVTVAHRMETIAESDVVIVLDKGRVVGIGKPAELLSRDSYFKKLNDR